MGNEGRSLLESWRALTVVGGLLFIAGVIALGVALNEVQADETSASPAVASSAPTAGTGPEFATTSLPADLSTTTSLAPLPSIRDENATLEYQVVATGLNQPVAATLVPGTDASFYVVERFGKVVLVDDTGRVMEVADLGERVNTEGAEQGLVGIALHPGYEENGRVFLSYVSNEGPLRIVEVAGVPETHALGDDERLILEVEQPGIVHHGGTIRFGPDGMLWVGLGDGGSSRDSAGHAQNVQTLQGSLVRIDVDSRTGDLPYGIPGGNAFPDGEEGAPEIWAHGLRNPWSFTFDEGDVFIADVGEERWEEINYARLGEPGSNFGWPAKHGSECFKVVDCEDLEFVDPVLTIPYDGLCAVVGGPVYRGDEIPMLEGQLLWADYCNGFVASISFDPDGPRVTRWGALGSIHLIANFVVDSAGEVYVIQQSGEIRRIVFAAQG